MQEKRWLYFQCISFVKTKSKNADHYGDMYAEIFRKWFEEDLIPNLSESSLIILDNASYGSKILNKVLNISSIKEELTNYLHRYVIPFDNSKLK